MPLIACPDCGKEISTEAIACIGCGRPISPSTITRPESAQAVKEGTQRAKLRGDLSNVVALLAVVVGVVLIFAIHPAVGVLAMLAGLGYAVWLNYGW